MSDPYAPPKVGATFQPGGIDDFLMPAAPPPVVVSPLPQKVMPEVPAQMQSDLARLELEANSPKGSGTVQSGSFGSNEQSRMANSSSDTQYAPQVPPKVAPPYTYTREGSYLHDRTSGNFAGSVDSNPSKSPAMAPSTISGSGTEPNFAEFPKLVNRASNVPESDDERRNKLENARMAVLSSQDPEMQLNWAQDTLTYVDTFLELQERLSAMRGSRSKTPQVEHQMREDAKNIVAFLADQHHPRAEFMKGMWLEFGKFGFREDKREAFRCYTRAAAKGYARAEYRMGMQFESTNEPISALQHYNAGLEYGDSACCYRMGMMALLGQLGQPQDFQRGTHLIQQSADTADSNAPQGAYVFGMLQTRDLPQIQVPDNVLPVNIASARHYIEKAAFLGFSKAQLKMGTAYELCSLGCEFDPTLSVHYNGLAAFQGEPEAEMAISKWFLCGYEPIFHKSEEKAYNYAKRAALNDLHMAQFALGYFHEIGVYVPVNLDKAKEWYEKADKGGNKDAKARLEGISMSRTLSKKDHENVAVAKIKSQYGSQRGKRPDRFTKPVDQMPTVTDEGPPPPKLDPIPGVAPISQQRPASVAPYPDERPVSVTPYPNDRPVTVTPYPDDRPVSVTPYPNDRPVSVAPYPLDDGPPRVGQGPRVTGGFLTAGDRPASSFAGSGYSNSPPNARPYTMQGVPPDPRIPPAGSQQPRPYSMMPEPNGRGSPYPDGQRVPSAPPVIQGRGRPLPPGPSRLSANPLPYRTNDPRYMDNSGDGRYGQPKPPYMGANNVPPAQSQTPPRVPYDARVSSMPITGSTPRPPERPAKVPLPAASPALSTPPPSQRPRPDASTPAFSTPPPSQRPRPDSNAPAFSGAPPNQWPRPDSSAPPMMSGGLATPAAGKVGQPTIKPSIKDDLAGPKKRPPGKGPTTFDEMGVPAGKEESDCVSDAP